MGAGRTPTKQQRELFFLQSLPEAALLSGTRSHTGREEQTATGSATFGFKPLHREMCWEESSSSEPSCSPALSQCPKIPAGLGCLIPISAKSAPAAPNAPIPVTRVKPNLDLNHSWEQGGKTDLSHCQIKTQVGDKIYPHQRHRKVGTGRKRCWQMLQEATHWYPTTTHLSPGNFGGTCLFYLNL